MVGARAFKVGDEEEVESIRAGDFLEVAAGFLAGEFHQVEVGVGGMPTAGFDIGEAFEGEIDGLGRISGEIELAGGHFGFEAGEGLEGEFATGKGDFERLGEDGPLMDSGVGGGELRGFESEAAGEEFGGEDDLAVFVSDTEEAGDGLLGRRFNEFDGEADFVGCGSSEGGEEADEDEEGDREGEGFHGFVKECGCRRTSGTEM